LNHYAKLDKYKIESIYSKKLPGRTIGLRNNAKKALALHTDYIHAKAYLD
jgi:hypothetical protein